MSSKLNKNSALKTKTTEKIVKQQKLKENKINKNKINTKINSNQNIKTNGLIDDVLKGAGTLLDVVETGSKLVSEPFDLSNWTKALPATISKVVSTVNDITSSGESTNKIVLAGAVDSSQDKKLLQQVEKSAMVIKTDAIPTSFASTFSRPDSFMYGSGQHGNFKTTTMKNTHLLSDMVFPAVGIGGSIVAHYQTSLFAYGNFGSRVDNFVKLFDRFRIKSLIYDYVPSCPTTTAGSIVMMYRRSPKGFFTGAPPTITNSDGSQLERYVEGSVFRSLSLVVPVESDFLYTGDAFSIDPKWYSNGYIGIGTNGGSTGTYLGKLGSLYTTVVIECYGAIPPTIFPALLPGPALTRILGMSIYQQLGSFKNEDLRNLFNWTSFILKDVIKATTKVAGSIQSLDKIKGLDRNHPFIQELCYNPKDYETNLFYKLSDIESVEHLLQYCTENEKIFSQKRTLTIKNKKFRVEDAQLDGEFQRMRKKSNYEILKFIRFMSSKWLDEKFPEGRERGKTVITSFINELLNYSVLEGTYLPWSFLIAHYNTFNTGNALTSPSSILKFLEILIADLVSIYSVDTELTYEELENIPLDYVKQITSSSCSLLDVFGSDENEKSHDCNEEEDYVMPDTYFYDCDDFGFPKHYSHEAVPFLSNPLLHMLYFRSFEFFVSKLSEHGVASEKIQLLLSDVKSMFSKHMDYTVENNIMKLSATHVQELRNIWNKYV